MAELKTRPTSGDVGAFLDSVPDPQRREDAKALCAMMERISGEPARMWGPSMVGFGSYCYRYESGREGEWLRTGFSPRANALTVYLMDGLDRHQTFLDRLGKHKTGKSCLYIKRLSDVDLSVLETLIRDSVAAMNRDYPEGTSGKSATSS